MTYNVKKSEECQEMVKMRTESKDKKKISFKKLVRKKTKENFLNIAFKRVDICVSFNQVVISISSLVKIVIMLLKCLWSKPMQNFRNT